MPDLEIPHYEDMDTNVHWSPAFAAALVAHALLILALTFGLNWRSTTDTPVVFEAELWAELPQEPAAGQPASPAPTPAPEPPAPEPTPAPEPPPPPPAPPPEVKLPDPTAVATGDIALQKAKEEQARQEAERQAQLARELAERERLAKEKAAQERQAQLAREKAERERLAKEKAEKVRKEREAQLAREKAERERLAKEKAEKDRKERERLAKEKAEKARQAQLAREKATRERIAKEKAEQARIEAVTQQMRNEQIQRAAGLAGSSGAQGNATVARGPSASYGAKVVSAVKPNIIFTGRVSNNPAATVEVKTAPSGEIIGRRLVRSSGVQAWDEAVLRAVDRTGFLPLDENGSIPSPLQIKFRPND